MFSLEQIANSGQASSPRPPGPGWPYTAEMMLQSFTGLRNLPQEFYSPTPEVSPMPGPSQEEQRFLQGLPPGFFGWPVAQGQPQGPPPNALQRLRPPTITLAQLFAGNSNAKGGPAARGGPRTLQALPPVQTPRAVDLPTVAGGYMAEDDALPPPPADNTNRAPPWFWPFR